MQPDLPAVLKRFQDLSVVLNVSVLLERSVVLSLSRVLDLSRVLNFKARGRTLPREKEPGVRPQHFPSLVVITPLPCDLCLWPSWTQQLIIQRLVEKSPL